MTKAIEAQNAQVASAASAPNRAASRTRSPRWCWSRDSSNHPTSSAPSCCAPTPTAPRCACATSPASRWAAGYQFTTRLNGRPSAGLSVLLSPTGNALATANAVQAKMEELSKFFPSNIKYEIPYDITPVVEASIKKVIMTLIEAVAGLRGDVPVSAEHPTPSSRPWSSRWRCLAAVSRCCCRTFHQHADPVRDGARHRHSRR